LSLQYIRNTYGVPAKRGARVEYTGNGGAIQGTITSSRGSHILVRLDGDKFSMPFHPTWQMRYLDAALSAQPLAARSLSCKHFVNGCGDTGLSGPMQRNPERRRSRAMRTDRELLELAAKAAGGLDWQWWTSNSYRRLTFKGGPNTRDGGALSGTVHPHDRWPDVCMAPGVQEFIERASPKAVLALIHRIAELEAALRPFSYEADSIEEDADDDDDHVVLVKVEHCRRAAAAMGAENGN